MSSVQWDRCQVLFASGTGSGSPEVGNKKVDFDYRSRTGQKDFTHVCDVMPTFL